MSALEQKERRTMSAPRAFHRIGIENKVGKRERKRKCGDRSSTRLRRAFTHPPRSQTARATIRDASRPFAHHCAKHPASPFAITSPRASSRFRNETLEIRENATKTTIGEHALLFAKNRFLLEKESDQKHAPGQSPRPPPRPRRTTWWFKDDNKLTTALPLALARFAKETRKWKDHLIICAVRTGFK